MPGLLRFAFQVAGGKEIQRLMSRIPETVRDLTPAWNKLADDFFDTEDRRFEDEGAYMGGPKWEALSDNPPGKGYKSWKEAHYPGMPILTLRGPLRASLSRRGAPGNVCRISPMSIAVGTNLAVGKSRQWCLGMLHQTGTQHMPARPPVWMSPQQKNRITRFIRMEVTDQMNALAIEANLKGTVPSKMSWED